MLSSKVVEVNELKGGDLSVSIESKDGTEELRFEKVLISIGRSPNTSQLNIDSTGVKVDDKNFIIVDEYQKTTVDNIFAIGDVAGNPMLAHKATHEGKVAAEVASGHPAAMDARVIPSAVSYTHLTLPTKA